MSVASLPIKLAAPAKVNLALHVGALGADGYHPVDSVCCFVDTGEFVSITALHTEFSLTRSGPFAGALNSLSLAQDLILKGANALANLTAVPRVQFHLHKTTPLASGLGAGTSDGAAAMVLLNHLASRPLNKAELLQAARVLGSDGPVCMAYHLERTNIIRMHGTGEKISALHPMPPMAICLANPGQPTPTGAIFSAFDKTPVPLPFAVEPTPHSSSATAWSEWMGRMRNDLAPAARSLVPKIATLEAQMQRRPGCTMARMSGSGASVFGIFTSSSAAKSSARTFRAAGLWSKEGQMLPAQKGNLSLQ